MIRLCKPRAYEGILATPIAFNEAEVSLNALRPPADDWPPRLAEIAFECYRELTVQAQKQRQQRLIARSQKLGALFEHYDCDINKTGSARELLLGLAWQHESAVMGGNPQRILRVFSKYHVNPNELGSDFSLAFWLAVNHVPGFSVLYDDSDLKRYDAPALASLWIAATVVKARLTKLGSKGSRREIADALVSAQRLKSLIPAAAADSVTRIVQSGGNAQRGHPSPLSVSTIRLNYLPAMETAWRDYVDENAKPLQIYLLHQAWPLIPDSLKLHPDLDFGYSEVCKRLEKLL